VTTGATLRLTRTADAPARVRHALQQVCAGAPASVVDDAMLLTSELVTNAVRHADGDLTVAIEREGDSIAVTVADEAEAAPVLRDAKPGDIGGRGLHLVDSIASAWGWNPTGHGKLIWFRVP